jgi:heme/copper-type cytochrome/quinol oxidase subunit 2
MRAFVTVMSGEDFQKWLDGQIKEQSEQDIFK